MKTLFTKKHKNFVYQSKRFSDGVFKVLNSFLLIALLRSQAAANWCTIDVFFENFAKFVGTVPEFPFSKIAS